MDRPSRSPAPSSVPAHSLTRAVAAACPNVPSGGSATSPNVPPPGAFAEGNRARLCPDLPEGAPAGSAGAFGKTKPPQSQPEPAAKPARTLSDGQLAAARLTVSGYGSKAIARHLGLNHHTIGRWKRDAAFAAELERLRTRVTEMTIARAAEIAGRDAARQPDRRRPPAANTAPAAPTDGRRVTTLAPHTNAEGRGCEALVERALRQAYGHAAQGRPLTP